MMTATEVYTIAFRVQLDRFPRCALSLGGPFRTLTVIYKKVSHLFKHGLDCYSRESIICIMNTIDKRASFYQNFSLWLSLLPAAKRNYAEQSYVLYSSA